MESQNGLYLLYKTISVRNQLFGIGSTMKFSDGWAIINSTF
jgi:hypothetical protein